MYRRDIDGLRAIAILSVVFFHAFPKTIPGGFIGVDIFFVLSGFLITNILFIELRSGGINWSSFYLKRIKRIFPALILVLISAIILGYFLLLDGEFEALGKHIVGSSLFLNNFVLWQEAGYFDKASELKPLLHLWSLGIEEQFYLFWPLLLFFSSKLRLNIFLTLITCSLISFLCNVNWVSEQHVSAFFLPFSRFWELAVGGVLAVFIYERNQANTPEAIDLSSNRFFFVNAPSFIGLFLLVIGFFTFREGMLYPGWRALIPTLGTALLILTPHSYVNKSLLSLKPMVFIGLISYPLYLWHWELLSFAEIVFSGEVPIQIIYSFIILSFFLAWVTYQFIEQPIRIKKRSNTSDLKVVACLVISLFSIGLFGSMIFVSGGMKSRSLVKKIEMLNSDIDDFYQYKNFVTECELNDSKALKAKITSCIQTHVGNAKKVIWGDSHAEHLLPGIMKLDRHNNWLLLSQSSCPPLVGVASYRVGKKDKCIEANKAILDAIVNNPNIQLVVLASLGPMYVSKEGFSAQHKKIRSKHILEYHLGAPEILASDKPSIFYAGLSHTVRLLKRAGKKVVLFQDVPEIPFMAKRCIKRPLGPSKPCIVSRSRIEERQKVYKGILNQVHLEQGVPLFDPKDIFCNSVYCQVMQGNHLWYRDSHHMSTVGSEAVANKFVPWLSEQV